VTVQPPTAAVSDTALHQRLQQALREVPAGWSAPAVLERLVRAGLDRLPLPGSGATLERWRALAEVAACDLSAAKLYEGHTDALAIRAELSDVDVPPLPADSTWGVWAAEAPAGRVVIGEQQGRSVAISGTKCWCSGAATASHALLTAWFADGRGPQLVRVALRQPGMEVSDAHWHAVGMAASASLDVRFDHAAGTLVGDVGSYLDRPGFWQGGAGIAACWFGGALGLASALRQAVHGAPPASRTALRMAALGKVDLALAETAALLREAARWIDMNPRDDASLHALRVRLSAERTAHTVLDEVGRALGAAPFCRDARFAQAAADLPVFVRQSHAERDAAGVAERLVPSAAPDATTHGVGGGWAL